MKPKKSAAAGVSSQSGLPRRDFLKLTGAGVMALALPGEMFAGISFGPAGPRVDFKQLAQTHDLPSLPDWGPYSKKYFGISHIPDVRRGLCFDFSIFPLPSPGAVKLPGVMDPSGIHPWEASGDLDFYSWRQELVWKDQFYCDQSFCRLDDHGRLVRMELVNDTDDAREVTFHCLAQLVFPPVKELTSEPIRLRGVQYPPSGKWVHGLDYAELKYAIPRATDNLMPDGRWRGEERRHDCVGGSVLADNFGRETGDAVIYRVQLDQSLPEAILIFRFQVEKGRQAALQMSGAATARITFEGTGKFETLKVPAGHLKAGVSELRLSSLGRISVALNGFVVVGAAQTDEVRFVDTPWHPVPEIEPASNGLVLKYEDVPDYYGLALGQPLASHRRLKWRELEAALGAEAGPNTQERIMGNARRGRTGDPDSLFIHTASQPLILPRKTRQVIFGIVCRGTRAEVMGKLAKFRAQSPANEKIYLAAKRKAANPASTPAGERYQFSQQLMAAVTLTNLVYPVYTQRSYLRHYSPGRSWDSLYTWDAGFTGLGLVELDLQHAIELLNTYMTPPGSQSAFIHHGSPVPVQFYLFQELWNRTQSRDLLKYFYPRLQQYHRFLMGRLGSSTTRRHRDRLICTWDYFYNSGGWDDYPPQRHVHQQKLEATVTPVVNSSHAIRCANILRLAALALDQKKDLPEYDEDIAVLSASLQKYSWDAPSGYFGYVVHDGEGRPTGILRDTTGTNFNMGLDGIYPLVAGICTREQEEIILQRLTSPKNLWMDIGITTVDQSAPYFSATGYWNGSVWMAHQWFFWKTMLDLGRVDIANRISQTGLRTWKKVTDATYDCMEHFMPQEPIGAGWHQFSSLSSPVLSWFASLYTPGRLTAGLDAWYEKLDFSQNNRRLEARIKTIGDVGRKFSVLACMNPDAQYKVTWNGKPARHLTLSEGLLQIHLERGLTAGELVVNRG